MRRERVTMETQMVKKAVFGFAEADLFVKPPHLSGFSIEDDK